MQHTATFSICLPRMQTGARAESSAAGALQTRHSTFPLPKCPPLSPKSAKLPPPRCTPPKKPREARAPPALTIKQRCSLLRAAAAGLSEPNLPVLRFCASPAVSSATAAGAAEPGSSAAFFAPHSQSRLPIARTSPSTSGRRLIGGLGGTTPPRRWLPGLPVTALEKKKKRRGPPLLLSTPASHSSRVT